MAAGVYWIGQDGNTYVKSAGVNGVQNLGKTGGALPTPYAPGSLTQIADPNAPSAPSSAPSSSSTSSTAQLNTGAVQNTQLAISQIAPLLAAALSSEGNNYTNAENALDSQQQEQQASYDKGTTTNQQNYDSNYMASIRAGIQGLGGLFNLLRGTGAAGGTAEKQVQDVVGGQTADDIRAGHDTQQQNQGSLDTTLSQFLTDLKAKKAAADDTHANNVAAINRDSATQLQDLYSKLAGYYGDAGQTDKANEYMGAAGQLTPQIASNSKTQTSLYDTTPVAVQAPQVTAFAAPTQPNIVAAPQDGQVGSGIFTISKRKDDTTPTATAPVAAAQGA